MKKILIAAFSLLFVVGSIQAQEYKKILKKASKTLGKYNLNPGENADKLAEAIALINQAFESEEAQNSPKALVTKGKIYTEIAAAEIREKLLSTDPEAKLATPDASTIALSAFTKAMNMDPGKGEVKDALRGLKELEGHLNNTGAIAYESKDFTGAFANFDGSLKARDLLLANKKKSRLDEQEGMLDSQIFTAAMTGYYAKEYENCLPYLESIYAKGSDEAAVYDALYNIKSQQKAENALEYLEEGRKRFPDDTGLLFSEINHYLQAGKLEELTTKLKTAIEKEPDNTSVYVTLGNVYDQLSTKELEAGNTAKANEYFDLAKDYFTQTLEKDPSNFDAQYSLGAQYYNKAASMTETLNKLSDDYTPAGTKKYNAAKAEMDGLFEKALPYFLKAEAAADAKGTPDRNTLIALKEIYARKNDLEKSAAYKAKIDAL